jgi:putative hydrolase of the HAD superfamily
MEDYLPRHTTARELLKTEIEKIELYGYGIKAFVLSMIETALRISEHTLPLTTIDKIIQLGRDLMNKPVLLLPGVRSCAQTFSTKIQIGNGHKG